MVLSQSLYIILKENNPDTAIDVMAPLWSHPLLARMPQISAGITSPFAHGELALHCRYRLARSLRATYQQAIVLPNSFKSALIPYWAGIAKRTGFRGEMRFGLINDMRTLDRQHLPRTVDRFAALGRDVGTPNESVPNPALRVDMDNARACAARLSIDFAKPILALMPGSAYGESKRWRINYFCDVANDYLRCDWQVWVFGSASDVAIGDEIKRATSGAAINLCGKTHLADAVDLLAQTKLAITNDSGLMHIAAAVGVPIVAIYGSTSPDFTPPMSARSVKIWKGIACSPCYQRVCRYGHYRCLTEITPQEVLKQSRHLIRDL